MRRSLFAAILGTAVSLCLVAFIPEACSTVPDQVKNPDPGDVVMNSCTACHSLERVCASIGKKDRDAWNTTVTAMVGRGARIQQTDLPKVVDYLAGLKPGSKPVCK